MSESTALARSCGFSPSSGSYRKSLVSGAKAQTHLPPGSGFLKE